MTTTKITELTELSETAADSDILVIVDSSTGTTKKLQVSNLPFTTAASTISDFDTEVGNHTDVTANTSHRGSTANPHSVTASQVSAVSTTAFQPHTSTSNPTATDDSYPISSIWVNTTTDYVWVCSDDSSSAAVWKVISPPIYGG